MSGRLFERSVYCILFSTVLSAMAEYPGDGMEFDDAGTDEGVGEAMSSSDEDGSRTMTAAEVLEKLEEVEIRLVIWVPKSVETVFD